jgi:hypothetical protein
VHEQGIDASLEAPGENGAEVGERSDHSGRPPSQRTSAGRFSRRANPKPTTATRHNSAPSQASRTCRPRWRRAWRRSLRAARR